MAPEVDDVSDLLEGGSEHGYRPGYRMSQMREIRDSPNNQESPLIHNHVTPPSQKESVNVKGWPQGAQLLRKYRGWGYLALFIDVLVTFLPVVFLR